MKKLNKKSAFTIIELLVVLSIIFLLSTVMMAAYGQVKIQTRDTKRFAEIQSLQKALEGYYAEVGSFPSLGSTGLDGWYGSCDSNGFAEFSSALQPLVQQEFIPQIPRDPMDPVASSINTQTASGCQTYFYRTQTADYDAFGTCGGEDVNNFAYIVTFATEKSTSNYPAYLQNNSQKRVPNRANGGEYCVLGPQIK
jgi:type II secretory pathway pseudopilin PulG